ncbi:tRNA methyltransferase 10 homolog B-like [Oppia nitens]|uniref:tRNA methyltransferase 10 homolog B-like n=1 Tax=Oppia nitens TaxID=1686743 RepID=UPI0023DA8144|nr:tRNA methyltransferase 10 homolog B-like [Oppia nitens]
MRQKVIIDMQFMGQMTNKEVTHSSMTSMSSSLLNNQLKSTLHRKSYLDVFPKHQLVYLSADSPKPLTSLTSTDMYIIGASTGQSSQKLNTYDSALRNGIRSVRLPIDEYVMWKWYNQVLSPYQTFAILLDFYVTNDWTKSIISNVNSDLVSQSI